MNITIKHILAATALTGTLIVTGCASSTAPLEPVYNRHKIPVVETIERLEIYTQPTGMALSRKDQDAVAGFLDEYVRTGENGLYINRPQQAGNIRGADEALGVLHGLMQDRRIPGYDVQEGHYNAGGAPSAPVVVSFRRLKVEPMQCGRVSDLTYTHSNQPIPEFGCVQRANLGAMISDPAQLIAPYTMSPSDNTRRSTVFEKYQAGEATAAEINGEQQVGASEIE